MTHDIKSPTPLVKGLLELRNKATDKGMKLMTHDEIINRDCADEIKEARIEAFEEAAKMVCKYCSEGTKLENDPAPSHIIPGHQKTLTVSTLCAAWRIHEELQRIRGK